LNFAHTFVDPYRVCEAILGTSISRPLKTEKLPKIMHVRNALLCQTKVLCPADVNLNSSRSFAWVNRVSPWWQVLPQLMNSMVLSFVNKKDKESGSVNLHASEKALLG
jgi:hypothetical protein